MTFNSLDEIHSLIKDPINKEMLDRAKELLVKHQLHVSGIGLDDYIDKIQGIENENAVSLRRALGKVITQPETQRIITVFDKVFSARGGGRLYEFSSESQEQFFKSEVLKDVKNGMSLRTYMSKIWKELVNIDANGLIMAEIGQNQKVFLSYKASSEIHDIAFKGAQKVEYVIFKPKETKEGNIYRVIDDRYDYLVLVKGKEITLIEEQTYINPWGYVPATFISDRLDKKSNGYTTHIYESMIPADDMLLDYTIHKIYKTRIGIPLHWQYARECGTCEGSGTVLDKDSQTDINCNICGGTGVTNHNRDVSEIIVLPIPETDDVPLAPPAGYVQPDLETWRKQEETIEKMSKKMYEVVWGEGATIEGDRRNITSSELIVRDNSKESKLNEISDNEENVEQFLTDVLGDFYFPGSYQGSIVNNGRHFAIKTTDELLKEYQDAIVNDLPTTQLNEILTDYYHSMYMRSPQRLNAAIVKMKTKPFFHWQPEKLQAANVNEMDYMKNLYYDEFTVWYEQNVEKFGITTIEKVQEELDKWILIKVPEPEGDEIDSGFSQEQLESQANLRGSVGGVQGILQTQLSVQQGATDYKAALELLKEIYGFSEEKAKNILGTPNINTNNIQNGEETTNQGV
jgi:hypothetical protein